MNPFKAIPLAVYLLWKCGLCYVFGHEPIVARKDRDSILKCERCGVQMMYKDCDYVEGKEPFCKNVYPV